MQPDHAKIAEQKAKQDAETARLKALWDKENAVDKGARRGAAAKAAAEQEARETPSTEDLARGREIFAAVHHHWVQRGSEPRHRLFLDGDNTTVLAHVFSMSLPHPFRKYASGHVIKLPADKFANDKEWCILAVSLSLQKEWAFLLDQEAKEQNRHAYNLAERLEKHEQRGQPTPEPPRPTVDFARYDGLAALSVGQEIDDLIRAKVTAIDEKTGDLKLLVLDPRKEHKHVHANKEYTFELHQYDRGKLNLWSLRDEEHECAKRHSDGHISHDADLLLVFEGGLNRFIFDLDSLNEARQRSADECMPRLYG